MLLQGPSEALSLVQIQPRLHQFTNRSPSRPPATARTVGLLCLPPNCPSTELPNRISLARRLLSVDAMLVAW